MVKSEQDSKKSQLPSDAEVLALMGDATTAIFLLRDYEKFGLAERVSRMKNDGNGSSFFKTL
jgi:hypothetical protein